MEYLYEPMDDAALGKDPISGCLLVEQVRGPNAVLCLRFSRAIFKIKRSLSHVPWILLPHIIENYQQVNTRLSQAL